MPERFHTIIHVDLDRAHLVADGDDPVPASGDSTDARAHGEPAARRDDRTAEGSGPADTSPGDAENRENREKRSDHDHDHDHSDDDGAGSPVGGDDQRSPNRAPRRRLARPERDSRRRWSVTNPDDIAYLRGIGALDGPSLNQVLCDSLLTVVGSRHGVAVHEVSPTRLATPAQRRALLALHPTCQFPGCGHTAYLQAHHVIAHHPRTGPTALWNLALLCSACHTRLHRPGWTAALGDDHTLHVWDPYGTLLTTGALRPETETETEIEARGPAKIAKSDPTCGDPSQRLHGTGEHLTEFGLDVYLHAWLEATAA